MISLNASISVIGFLKKCAQMSNLWVMCFFLMKLTSQIREMWIGIICIIWANENPLWMRTVPFQHSWPVNGWCGIVGDRVIDPYFLEGRLTGLVYANFLQNVLPQLMKDVPLHVRMNMWMQDDGAPHHYALCSRQAMNEIFDEKTTWKKEYAEHVPKLHHKSWLKLDGLFINKLKSAYKSRVITSSIFYRKTKTKVSGSFESDYSDMFRIFDYFHTLRVQYDGFLEH